MSEARVTYESAMDEAVAVLGDDCRKAYAAFDTTAQAAWYDYQVRTGMIPVPDAIVVESETSDDSGQGSGPPGRDRPGTGHETPGGKPGIHPGEGDQGPGEDGAGDEDAAEDFR